MKKMILAAALVAGATFGSYAEENVNLPEAGDFGVEVQFNPFSSNFTTFGLDNMKLEGRYFLTNRDAVRVGLGFGVNSTKDTPNPEGDGIASELNTINRTGKFAIDLGYERHFFKKGRVDLYAGGGLGFALQNTCKTEHKLGLTTTGAEVIRETKEHNADSYTQFNVNLFSGIDFYVYKGLYVGAELGLRVGFKTLPGTYYEGGYITNDGKWSPTDTGEWSDNVESNKGPKSTTFDLATYVVPALRLGWTF